VPSSRRESRENHIKALLEGAGITTKAVKVLGRFVHVDSFRVHEIRLQNLLIAAGFEILRSREGIHLCGYNGYRLSARVKGGAA